MKLVERLMATSKLDTDVTEAVAAALKSGVTAEEVRDVLARIVSIVEAECE